MFMFQDLDDYDLQIASIEHMNERKPDPTWKIDRLVNPNHFIMAYCLEGEAIYHFAEREVRIRQGDLLFFTKGLIRSASSVPDNPWSFYTISFDILFMNDQCRERFDQIDPVIRSPHLFRLPSLFAELSLIWTGKRSGYKIKCKSIIMDILFLIIQEKHRAAHGSAHYHAIERTANLILTRYREDFSIDELARLSGLSASHFRLLFKRITGMTAVQYQNHIRINKAKDLLLSGECNVTEAAFSVGFQDIYYFSRLFKKMTGETPSHYIKA